MSPRLMLVVLASCASVACSQNAKPTSSDGGLPFEIDPATVYVAKVKNILVGLRLPRAQDGRRSVPIQWPVCRRKLQRAHAIG